MTFTAEVPFGTTARLRLPAGVQAPENGAVLDGGRHEFCWKSLSPRVERPKRRERQ